MSLSTQTKRGDTLIEVMFAFAVFSLVAILSITMMNLGLAASERSLEVTVVRNEMNAQAEALRFIHSSYIAELNLPRTCDAEHPKCQQYAALWEKITSNAMLPANATDPSKSYSIEMPVLDCRKLYEGSPNDLERNNAFVLNTRRLLSTGNGLDYDASAYISAIRTRPTDPTVFQFPPLDARIIYTRDGSINTDQNSEVGLDPLSTYIKVSLVEGLWVVAVQEKASNPNYYDFHIGSCWYGASSQTPTSLDTVVRLYNPGGN